MLAAEVAVAVGGEVVRLVELRILVQGGPNSPQSAASTPRHPGSSHRRRGLILRMRLIVERGGRGVGAGPRALADGRGRR